MALASAIYDQGTLDRVRQVWLPNWIMGGIDWKDAWKKSLAERHMNPVIKGLVYKPEYWRYSSARYCLTGETCDISISDFSWIDE